MICGNPQMIDDTRTPLKMLICNQPKSSAGRGVENYW
jgi:hypothetical protein